MRWSEEVKNIFRPRERLRPSQWAQRHRFLKQDQSARTGPWRNEAAPYLKGAMDITARPGLVALNICKATQIGFSEAMRCVLGYWADYEPDPVGITLPDEKKGKDIVSRRILPLFRETPVLRRLMTSRSADAQRGQIRLRNGFLLSLMWSGSPSSMASDPMRRVLNDEVDKFVPFAGREGDPVGLTEMRLRSYGGRKLQINVSSPTDRFGKIWRLFEGSDYLFFYFVPCPRCGTYQRLLFPQLKWRKPADLADKKELARRIRGGELPAWYECAACGGPIPEEQKPALVNAGRWSSGQYQDWAEDGVFVNVEAVRSFPPETRVGMQISALYCLWEQWGNLAAKFIEAEGDQEASYLFRTGQLGEPFEAQVNRMYSDRFSQMCQAEEAEEGIVPDWAAVLLATVDTQQDHFYAVVRAWGGQMRSQRIWHGKLRSFEDLEAAVLKKVWACADRRRPPLRVELVLIDTGGTRAEDDADSRTMQVYAWASLRTLRVRAIKGSSRKLEGRLYRESKVFDYSRGKRKARKGNLTLWLIDSHKCQSQLAQLMNDQLTRIREETGEEITEPLWLLNRRDDPEYNQQMSNLNMVQVRKGLRTVEEWRPVTAGARHDYRDCEAYQIAAAYMARVHLLSEEDVQRLTRPAETPPPARPEEEERPPRSDFVNRTRRRSGSWFGRDR